MAVSHATRLGIDTVLLGINADDVNNPQIPELTCDYVEKFEEMVKTSRKTMSILTPFIQMSKHEVYELGKNWAWTTARHGAATTYKETSIAGNVPLALIVAKRSN